MAKTKKPLRVYPLINEVILRKTDNRQGKVSFLDPRIVKVKWLDTNDFEEVSREMFYDTNFSIIVRNYDF
jgi:hypothetical protein